LIALYFIKGGEWLSELERNVEDRNDVFKTSFDKSDATKSGGDEAKENIRRTLTKLSALPALKNNPATRQAFKPVS
jgi:hypothetical protein